MTMFLSEELDTPTACTYPRSPCGGAHATYQPNPRGPVRPSPLSVERLALSVSMQDLVRAWGGRNHAVVLTRLKSYERSCASRLKRELHHRTVLGLHELLEHGGCRIRLERDQ